MAITLQRGSIMNELSLRFVALGSCAFFAAGQVGCGDDETTGGTGTGSAPDAEVSILFTSDEHSHLVGFAPELDDYPTPSAAGDGSIRGGIARRMALVTQLRQEAADRGASSLLVSAGDSVMGSLPHITFETSSADYAMMTAVGYDVINVGNHELDFGPGVLAAALSSAQAAGTLPAMLASNIRFSASDAGDDALAALYSEDVSDGAALHPYHVVDTDNGVRVGFIGFLGADAAFVAPNKTPVLFSGEAEEEEDTDVVLAKLYADLQPTVDQLRQVEGVDLVVALSHAGLGVAEEDKQICQNVSGLDLVLSGHSHNTGSTPVELDNPSGRKCVVLNGGRYGELLGRIDVTVSPGSGGPISWNAETQALTLIDDSILPDPAMASLLDDTLAAIEAANVDASGKSYLERLVSHAEGSDISDDTSTPGDLYFHVLASTDFDITDDRMLNFLSADAMLAASDDLGLHSDMALESAGVVRAAILQGRTGDISVADAFAVVPLGSSPADPSSVGYPLTRAYLGMFEILSVFEITLEKGPSNSDFNLGQAGVKVEYDASQPSGQRVLTVWTDSDHSDGFEQYDTLLFDRAAGYTYPERVSVVTSSYVFQFAGAVGVKPRDETGAVVTLEQALLLRPDNSEVKQLEAFLHFLRASPGGSLPSVYDETSPSATDRFSCVLGC